MLNGILSPAGSDELGWDEIQRRRKFAEALMSQGADYSPVGSWTQGLARMAQGLVGGYEAGKMEKEEKAANKPLNDAIAAYLRGGASPSPVAPSQAMTTADATPKAPGMAASGRANLPGDMATWASAIRKKESAGSGDYAAIGPTHPKLGRALGAYQVMEANIGPWSREALGREVSPDEFLRNPQIQDQIFQHKFGQYVQKYGNPQDAASAWFTGRPLAQGANARDVLGTTGAQYVADFNRNAGVSGAPAPAPVQMAQAGGTMSDGLPPGPVPSNAPPMAYAPNPAMGNPITPPAPFGSLLGAQFAMATPPMPPARPPGLSEAPVAPDAPAPSAAPAGPAPQRVAQALMPQAAPVAGPDPRNALLAAALSGRASPQLRQTAMTLYQIGQQSEGVSPVDLGDRIALMNKRGQVTGYLPKTKEATFGVVGEDAFGAKTYGFIDPSRRTVAAANPDAARGGAIEVTAADGRKIAVPPGMDPKEFRKTITQEGAKSIVSAPDALRKAQEGLALIRATKNHPGLYWGTGMTSMLPDLPGTDRRAFAAYHDQLKGQSFLQAFEGLKGGGQITEVEGNKATQAIARLDRAQSPEDYKKALDDLEAILSGAVARLQKLPGMAPPADQPAPDAQPAQRRRFNPATGRIE